VYQTETIIALGSNLGNAIFNLRCAVRELENIGNIKKFANIYISSPYGYKSQSNFFNQKEKWIGVHLNGEKIYGSSLKEIRHIIDYPSLHSK